jgi:hypothetical protein
VTTTQFGDFELDPAARQLTSGGRVVHLSPKAFDLLALLVRQRPQAVSKSVLIDSLWPDVHVDEANLKNLIHEIRTALEASGGSPEWIRTVHRVGYAFAASAGPGRAAFLIEGTIVHRLKSGPNIVGRSADASAMILLPGVSRHHATIRIADDRATIEDAGSKNGTFVNESPVTGPAELHDGDVVGLGPARLRFRFVTADDSTTDGAVFEAP